ncbi:hypothetical protein CUJ83_13560 [Methanocella sp. CWC-04]|uniref:CAAX prenyl protease 2/Lysostaphin resistance protein A-like domain-containing protein n=1 Tax=Methanooceanicella nereidis TaxID=2052831 RepID=A0AAP2W5W9_9EURY|nr:hypothetical protein [Methanocella sp. CWC-04]
MKDKNGKVTALLKIVAVFIVLLIAVIAVHASFIIGANMYYSMTSGDPQSASDKATALLGSIEAQVAIVIVQNIVFILIAYLFYTKVDRKKFSPDSFGLRVRRDTLKLFGLGMLLDVVFIGSLIGISILTGQMSIVTTGFSVYPLSTIVMSFVLLLVATLAVGFGEEILYRGYIQSSLMEKFSMPVALCLASFVFVISHAVTHVQPIYFISIFVLALVFGYLFVVTRSLYVPIGFHFLEDFMVFNVFVSGESGLGGSPIFILTEPAKIYLFNMDMGTWPDAIALGVGLAMLAAIYVYDKKINASNSEASLSTGA